MKTKVLCFAMVLMFVANVAVAQRSASSKITGNAYNFYSGSMYTRHASEHARVINSYEGAPAEVVQEHTAAVRHNVAKAKEALAKVKPLAKDAESKKLVQTIESHYADCDAHCEKIAAAGDDHKMVADCCKDLTKSLDAAAQDHSKLMKKLGIEPLSHAADGEKKK